MKLGSVALGTLLAVSLCACGAGYNGGWVTKGGWDSSSRAPAPRAQTAVDPSDNIPLSALDLENPYLKADAPKLALDPKSPFDKAEDVFADEGAKDGAKAKAKSADPKATKPARQDDEPGF